MVNKNIISNDEYLKLETFVTNFNKTKDTELEISFKHINYNNFMRIIEYLVENTDSDKILSENSLDVSIVLFGNKYYRVSILNEEKIDKFLENFKNKTVSEIQDYIISLKNSEDYAVIIKDRNPNNMISIENLNLNIKLATETQSDSSQIKNLTGTEKMLYRYKKRYSFIKDRVRYDLTEVRQTLNIYSLSNTKSSYEIEMEVIKKISVDEFLEELTNMLALVQDSVVPIDNIEEKQIVDKYISLLGLQKNVQLDVRNVVSIETQHLNFIPNRYAVTEKADGERSCLIILSSGVYFVTTNMKIKKTELQVKNSKYFNTILDGELIKFIDKDKSIFMVFDIIYSNGIDYRYTKKYTLNDRIKNITEIIAECFDNLIPYKFYVDVETDMELNKINEYNKKEIKKYWKQFNKKFNNFEGKTFVTRKIHFIPYGIDRSEIFMYADTLWKTIFYGNIAPYKLDGVIYTPINEPYMIKINLDTIDTVPHEYKWKPPNQNSIDFYIEFEKDSKGNEEIFSDTSDPSNTIFYKVCKLFVSIKSGNKEKPVVFKVNGEEQKANIYVVDDIAVDTEGNSISDKTVVEFIYDTTKPDLPRAFNWIALRTRHDKTESVRMFKKKYGNNLSIATRIWRSIVNPITEESITVLGNPETFQNEMKRLTNPKSYYGKISTEGKSMRAFNNWLKFILINTYCQYAPSVLDIGCGRGGDLQKFITTGISEYVGVDIDNSGLYTIKDSAISRYNNLKSRIKNVPPMYFINCDARAKFNVDDQNAVISGMTENNKKLIATYLSGNKKYNIINAQFTIHYYLSDSTTWNNFCQNINDHIENNGYLLITCFDGDLIYNNMKNKQKLNVSYTDNNGKKVTFFEIIKAYSNDTNKELGVPIEFYNSLYSEEHITEFLVFPDFLIRSLKEKCNLDLIETDSFFNMFNLYKEYFTSDTKYGNDKRYSEIREFYTSIDPNIKTVESDKAIASFKLSMLNRYYVFKKKINNIGKNQSRIINVNNHINLGSMLTPYFMTNSMIIKPTVKSNNINKIYAAVIKKYYGIKPSVYLVRHYNVVNDICPYNKFDFVEVKNTGSDKILLIYKSPDKYFYPIYFKGNSKLDFNLDETNYYINSDIDIFDKGTYMLESSKILDELRMLVTLTEKINGN